MALSIDAENILDKLQHTFMIKTLRQLGIEMQIKAPVMYYFTPTRMHIKNRKQVLMKMWKNSNHCTLLVRIQNVSAAVEKCLAVSQKLNIKLSFNPAIPFLGIYSK